MSEGTSHPRLYPALPPEGESHRRAQALCAGCPKLCRHTCPVADAEKRETVTPTSLMSLLHLEAEGHLTLSEAETEIFWHCSSCRACQEACAFHSDVPGALHARRGEAFKAGQAPEPARRLARRFYERGGNLYGLEPAQALRERLPARLRARMPERPDAGTSTSQVRDLILVDCVTMARHPEVIDTLVWLLERLNLIDVEVHAGEPTCCGLPLYDAGDLDGFHLHASAVVQRLNPGGEKSERRIFGTSPGCTHAMRDLYRAVGVEWSVRPQPLVELILPALTALPESEREAAHRAWAASDPTLRLVVHTPCLLARPLGQPDALVQAITRVTGAPPRIPRYAGRDTECCGGGGGLPAVVPEVADAVARRCLDHLELQDGEQLVTGCASSRRRFEQAGSAPVLDWIFVVAEALRAGDRAS